MYAPASILKRDRKRSVALACGLVCLLLAAAAAAQVSDRDQPITIEADQAELFQEEGKGIYTGNVHITQGRVQMWGNRLVILRNESSGETEATLYGSPARFRQEPASQQDELTRGRANQMDYATDTEVLVLTGNAEVFRGEVNEIKAHRIVYNTQNRRSKAEGKGGGDGRVRIVIDPNSEN